MPQRRHGGGKGAKLHGKVKAVSSSEARAVIKAAAGLAEACGLTQLPLQMPDAVHANVVLVA